MLAEIWRGRLGGLRLLMLLAAAGLVLIGVLSIRATDKTGEFTERQLFFACVGLAVIFAVNLVPYQTIGRWSGILFFFSLLLLALVLLGKRYGWSWLVPNIRGAARWIDLPGIDFLVQPSELAKISYVLALAWYLRNARTCSQWRGLILPFGITFVPMMLILIQPDLGTVLLFPPMLYALLFCAGAKIRHLLIVMLAGAALSPLFYYKMHDYQKLRIQVLLRQNTEDAWWLRGPGYQLEQSKNYIGSGGLWGQDAESSVFLKYQSLPDSHNDFIFAMIGHQRGFAGCMGVFLLFSILVIGGVEIAANQPEAFGRLTAIGITALLATQMLVNVGMTVGLMPITGMTLPFVSYGGSSLVTSCLGLGLLINVARHRPIQMGRSIFEAF